jgi:hypothetical protein
MEGNEMEWRIFFIGPMSVENPSDGSAKPVDYKLHLPKLPKYVVSHLKTCGYIQTSPAEHTPTQGSYVNRVSLERGEDKITTFTPYDLHGSGNIPEEVFDAIDHSDLVIADLSGNRQAVTYELALAHALGIETILVSDSGKINFYLNQFRIIQNIDFSADAISSHELAAGIDNWIDKRNKLFDSNNPLKNFYGVPLPDISAASGLAVGFYANFALPILNGGVIVHKEGDSEKTSKLKGFIVLNPKNFARSVMEMEDALEELLISSFKEEVKRGEPGKIFIRTPAGDRTAFFLVRDYLIDIPRTMFSLKYSPRLRRAASNKAQKSNMEGVLINRFFESVKEYLEDDPSVQQRRKFHLGSLDEIPSIIETGKSKTWPT